METLPLLPAYIPDLSQCHFYLTVNHCTNHSSFPLQWRLLLCGGSLGPVSSNTTQLSLWPNRGDSVFMAQSGQFSQSDATQHSPWGFYYKCLLTQIEIHMYHNCLPPCQDPGVLHPSTQHIVMGLHHGTLWTSLKRPYFYWYSKLLWIVSN